MNNRLDFITNIHPDHIARMTEIRKKFIELDASLELMSTEPTNTAASLRTISLSRTNIEIACQFAIKSLCLLGEIKPID